MLKKLLNWSRLNSEKGKKLHFIQPLVKATDSFFYEAKINTKNPPYVRDAVDVKRWMILVIIALIPAILMAIWNSGLQKFVYISGNYQLVDEYFAASSSFRSYFSFVFKDMRYLTILKYGLSAFLPVVIISYVVGGFWEVLFACVRRHDIAEGFLVSGILYPLILPPTLPYWMIALGISFGVVVGKELFGGTGMNILNPALVARCFIFFAFPAKMSGDVYVGTNSNLIDNSLKNMNANAPIDGYTQASALSNFNISTKIKKVHVDAIAASEGVENVGSLDVVERQFDQWNESIGTTFNNLSPDQVKGFVTSPIENGGLDLTPNLYSSAYDFASLKYGIAKHGTWNFFFGNQIGCFGETSVLACLLGAFFLIFVGIGAWRTVVATGLFAFLFAFAFQFFSDKFGVDGGAWNPAKFSFPAYKHLLLGGFAFGMVFMATDPVSSPGTNLAKWIYGAIIGIVVMAIRIINPAYPEGVMLAILFGNICAPLIDHYSFRVQRRKQSVVNS